MGRLKMQLRSLSNWVSQSNSNLLFFLSSVAPSAIETEKSGGVIAQVFRINIRAQPNCRETFFGFRRLYEEGC
jgi:hypothetical protein